MVVKLNGGNVQRLLLILKSKVFWAGVAAAGGYITTQPKIGIGEVVIAGSMVVGAAGIKDNFSKYLDPRVPTPGTGEE